MSVIMPAFDVRPVLASLRERGCEPLFMAVTGSHSWGLATAESDVDLRGVYAWPTKRALSLHPGRDNEEHVDGVIDYQAYELAKALRMLVNANGNVVEMLHNPLVAYNCYWGLQLRYLAEDALTQRLADYYRGYATSQRKRAGRNRGGKALVYTYREMFAGIFLMAEGEIEFDFCKLWVIVERRWYHSEILPWAMDNRNTPVSDERMIRFENEWAELTAILDQETLNSCLPERTGDDFVERCNDLLLEYRLKEIQND